MLPYHNGLIIPPEKQSWGLQIFSNILKVTLVKKILFGGQIEKNIVLVRLKYPNMRNKSFYRIYKHFPKMSVRWSSKMIDRIKLKDNFKNEINDL